ncbi:MAG: UDP-2,3-diacylglucosamine diphosphatase LpxI [Holosporales bacterium]|jgi:DUF1009 family protein|nr:UDP-2,3-diacylglucosamine diphosphatase LpxI [Holosporales bacterium]
MRLGLLCGKGRLPYLLARAQRHNTFAIVCLEDLEEETTENFPSGIPCLQTSIGAIGKILRFLKAHQIDTIVMAGALRRPTLSELKLDVVGIKWSAHLGRRLFQGDDALLSGITALLEREKLTVLGAHEIMTSLLTPAGILSKKALTPEDQEDITVGIRVMRQLGKTDVGQAVVVQQGLTLGVEAIEGTQELIKRCASFQRAGRAAILVKGAKPQQEMRVDLPTIGSETLEALHIAGFRGVALEAGKTLLLDREIVLEKADSYEIFVAGMEFSYAS